MSTCDVAVVGRGAIGSAAALAFARAGWRVALVAPAPRTPAGSASPSGTTHSSSGAAPASSLADWDQRVYALSAASRMLLMDLGVWQLMDHARIAPIHDMRIFNHAGERRRESREVHLDAYQGRVEALAWIVENRELQSAVDRAIAGAFEIDLMPVSIH